jgi:hypothetical protein
MRSPMALEATPSASPLRICNTQYCVNETPKGFRAWFKEALRCSAQRRISVTAHSSGERTEGGTSKAGFFFKEFVDHAQNTRENEYRQDNFGGLDTTQRFTDLSALWIADLREPAIGSYRGGSVLVSGSSIHTLPVRSVSANTRLSEVSDILNPASTIERLAWWK